MALTDYQIRAIAPAYFQKFTNAGLAEFSSAIEAAATAPLLARIAELEACLLQTQNAAIDLAKQIRKEHEPGPVNLWDGTPAKYGIAPADKQSDIDAALETPKLPLPNCPKCGDNRQVWRNQVTGLLTCHRINCHTVIEGNT